MRFIFSFLFFTMISLSAWADYTLAVFGDSLSSGYRLPKEDSFYAQLGRTLKAKGYKVNVLNASKSGETTKGGVDKVATLLSQKPNGVILELGINDSFKSIPIETIKGNLENLITTFKRNNISVLLVGMKTLPNKPTDYQRQFEKMYRDLASKYDLELYPFFMEGLFGSNVVWSIKLQNDNLMPNDIHPTAKGVGVMVQGILPTVERFLKKQKVFP